VTVDHGSGGVGMSIDSSTRTAAVPGSRAGEPATERPSGALYGATGEHIGLSPVAKALHRPTGVQPAIPLAPAPTTKQLLGLCAAAALLGIAGIIVGVRGWIGLVMHQTESWFLTTIVALGVLGVISAAASFLLVHRRYAPWVAITVSGLVLIASIVVTTLGVH
jgi:hypothetical protein